ncbi:hypothetical protein AAVH_19290 [Aphelenchoides avenae]|nr:hypothetical protein AAVH_19290 [Aphelenchus avenae]
MDDYVRQMFDGVQALSIFSKNSRPELPSAISTPLNVPPKDIAGILEELNKPSAEFSPLAIAAEDDVPSALRPYRR